MSAGEPAGAADPDRERRAYRVLALALPLAIAACFLLVFPIGEYAVDDDWAYVRSLLHLQEEGRLVIFEWNPMSLVGHLVWGWLFTATLGFSFTATKIAVVATFVVECVALLAVLRHLRVPAALAALALTTLALNPLHFFHAFEFGTDVPAAAWSTVALLCWMRALDALPGRRQLAYLLAGSCLAAAGFLVRQSGALIVAALALHLVLWDRERLRAPRVLLPAFVPAVAAIAGFTWWQREVYGVGGTLPRFEELIWTFIRHPSPLEIGRAAFVVGIYAGLFLVPLSLAAPPARPRGRTAMVFLVLLALAGAAVTLAVGPFPYLRNKLTPFGYLRPNEFILGDRPVLWPPGMGWLLSAVLLVSALLLVAAFLGRVRTSDAGDRSRGEGLVVALFVVQAAYGIVTWPILFDRHLILLAPTVVALYCLLVRERARPHPRLFAILMLPLAFYSIAGTHDVHAISRAAFAAGRELVAAGIHPRTIDAGYAFDGWHVHGSGPPSDLPAARPHDAWWVRRLFPSIRTDYVVALTPVLRYREAATITGWDREIFLTPRLDGYRALRIYRYRTYWPWGEQKLYVLVDLRGQPAE